MDVFNCSRKQEVLEALERMRQRVEATEGHIVGCCLLVEERPTPNSYRIMREAAGHRLSETIAMLGIVSHDMHHEMNK